MDITIQGKVDIGEELELEQQIAPRKSDYYDEVSTVGGLLAPCERRASRSSDNPIEKRLVDYELRTTGRKLSFENQGLALQYAVMGGPESGKTNLLMHLLSQIVFHRCMNPNKKFGGLILDPKAALIDHVKDIFHAYGRQNDLIVINTTELKKSGGINVLASRLKRKDMGEALKTIAESIGKKPSESYWMEQGANLIGALIALISFTESSFPTLAQIIKIATLQPVKVGNKKTKLENLRDIATARYKEKSASKTKSEEDKSVLHQVEGALSVVEKFLNHEAKVRDTVASVIDQAYNVFLDYDNMCYSPEASEAVSIYDQIINDGKFILVSVNPGEIILSKILPTLTKWIFQRTVLNRSEQGVDGKFYYNTERPLLFMADEYHIVATQMQGDPFGDSGFFSQAREFGALSIVATQTIEQLKSSPLGDNWKAVLGTLAAIIFMKQADPATCEFARDRGGKVEKLVRKEGKSTTKDGPSTSENYELVEEYKIPPGILENKLVRGKGVMVGTVGGSIKPATVSYFQVPKFEVPKSSGV